MKTSHRFQIRALLATGAFFICGQQGLAQDTHHRQFKVMHQDSTDISAAHQGTTPAADIYALQASFTQVNKTIGPNADGNDLWPCFGPNNPDCATIGNPQIPLPDGAVVVGTPQYVWKLQNNTGYGYNNGDGNGNGCDALVNGTSGPLPAQYKPCGQIATWYEDDSNDPSLDLIQRLVVTQGNRVIYDSGTVDYGPAPSNLVYPVTVLLYTDANFGFWPGEATGPNNGNCTPDTGYPLTSPANPGAMYVVAADRTCQEPVPGLATFTTSTALAVPAYTQMTGAACTFKGAVSPCYKVEWTRKYEIKQDFNIFLE
jgi:hypothetical protein